MCCKYSTDPVQPGRRQELSTTLKSGLKELLEDNQDLKEKANFDVEIGKLT